MSKKNIIKIENEFIEKFAGFFQANNHLPRIAARIMAYLLICQPKDQSAKNIIERLGIAKSSSSTMLNLLIKKRIIKKGESLDDRSTYYRIMDREWGDEFFTKLKAITKVRGLLARGKKILKKGGVKDFGRINDIDKLYAFFEIEFPGLIKRWEKFKK